MVAPYLENIRTPDGEGVMLRTIADDANEAGLATAMVQGKCGRGRTAGFLACLVLTITPLSKAVNGQGSFLPELWHDVGIPFNLTSHGGYRPIPSFPITTQRSSSSLSGYD